MTNSEDSNSQSFIDDIWDALPFTSSDDERELQPFKCLFCGRREERYSLSGCTNDRCRKSPNNHHAWEPADDDTESPEN